jgi:DNA-binding transcriptional MerR regulator
MDYLIKDLSKMTGIASHAIRKWQERYNILRPFRTPNGYWHYSNDDYFVLKSIQMRLDQSQKLKKIMALGREALLKDKVTTFSEEQLTFIKLLQAHDYDSVEKIFDKQLKGPFSAWVHHIIGPAVILVGKAWEENLLSVPEEHAFSHWLHGYIFAKIEKFPPHAKPGWLVTTFPGDPHDLSSLLHYAVLRSRGISAWYTGNLPENDLLREVESGKYIGISISVVLEQPEKKVKALESAILARNPKIKIRFGGFGMSMRKKNKKAR